MQASSRDEIKEVLRKDVYANSGVWDVENVSLFCCYLLILCHALPFAFFPLFYIVLLLCGVVVRR
jgi:hypothetical protein